MAGTAATASGLLSTEAFFIVVVAVVVSWHLFALGRANVFVPGPTGPCHGDQVVDRRAEQRSRRQVVCTCQFQCFS